MEFKKLNNIHTEKFMNNKNKNLKTLLTAGAIASLMVLAACGQRDGGERTLNIYNWNDYIAEDTISKFEEETGIKVVYDQYDDNAVVEAKLSAGNSGYDLVVPSASFLERFINAELIQKIDKSKLPNLKNIDPAIYYSA